MRVGVDWVIFYAIKIRINVLTEELAYRAK